MIVTVVFALDAEWAVWRRVRSFEQHRPSPDVVFHEAVIGESRVRVLTGGIRLAGLKESAAGLFAPSTDVVISAGLSGGLRHARRSGEVLSARRVRSQAGGVVECDRQLCSMVVASGALEAEAFVCVDRVLRYGSEKTALASEADAADMESFLVLKQAANLGVATLSVRAIGDTVEDDLPLDFGGAIRPDGRVSVSKLAREAIGRPAAWPSLVNYAMTQRRAIGALVRVLDRFVAALPSD